MTPEITFILGTRPEIIKLSPIIREAEDRKISYKIIHTGQHYSDELDKVFFERLRIPDEDYNLGVGSDSHGKQTGKMISDIDGILRRERPDTVIIQGDTNSVLAGSIAASKIPSVSIAHVEAGLRSYEDDMPEEINRRLTDHSSDYLFPPTDTARNNLLDENIPPSKITVVGNTIVDAVQQNVKFAMEESEVEEKHDLNEEFCLLTAHRAENVDKKENFDSLLKGVAAAGRAHDLQVVYPIHPRAESRISEFNITIPEGIKTIDPVDFIDFLYLENRAEIVFTDSGGVQEECCILQTPCVTIRSETERPETVEVGANLVVGVAPGAIKNGAKRMMGTNQEWDNPFGKGDSSKRILDELLR